MVVWLVSSFGGWLSRWLVGCWLVGWLVVVVVGLLDGWLVGCCSDLGAFHFESSPLSSHTGVINQKLSSEKESLRQDYLVSRFSGLRSRWRNYLSTFGLKTSNFLLLLLSSRPSHTRHPQLVCRTAARGPRRRCRCGGR